ncbi:ClpXP protease specificity-enhancing factor [Thorsellia kenyensis]|uniref:ClpXP protease specificity-enhancing factor n=1 Tax=Thorsellia kenyensis TaxID=1549888 RepID=A0ABV6CEY6_9GAMM
MTIDVSNIKPLRPYLLRAHYEWLVDNNLTPYLLVNTTYPGADVPLELAKNGEIVFNISMSALDSLSLGNDFITFNASFNGKTRQIIIPLGGVVAIYAKENNMGLGFPPESYYENEREALEAKQSIQVLEENNSSEVLDPAKKTSKKNPKTTNQKSTEKNTTSKKESPAKKSNTPKKASHLRIID